ncbi:MAG TPA: ACT domain-containing protein [Clostridiales bacterium]|nr:ACT domain-containing protein [Clostridiales bacterium]
MSDSKFLLVKADVLPDVYLKVLKAKQLLSSGRAKNASEAAKISGISRSTFYKYKDSVFSYKEKTSDRVITIHAVLKDKPGVLSAVMSKLYKSGANILTINQNIPIDNLASVSISIRTELLKTDVEELINSIRLVDGVVSINQVMGE